MFRKIKFWLEVQFWLLRVGKLPMRGKVVEGQYGLSFYPAADPSSVITEDGEVN